MRTNDVKIEFVKIERDCGYNVSARAKNKRLIYDFKVIIDGQHRVTFLKFGPGTRHYVLSHVPDGESLKIIHHQGQPDTWKATVVAGSQKQFMIKTLAALKAQAIPTMEQMKEREEQLIKYKLEAAADQKATELEEARIDRLNANAPALYRCLKNLVELICGGARYTLGEDCAEAKRVLAATEPQ